MTRMYIVYLFKFKNSLRVPEIITCHSKKKKRNRIVTYKRIEIKSIYKSHFHSSAVYTFNTC